MSEYQTVALIYVGLGCLLMLLGIPLMARVVGPNRLYGYRTKTTLNNREIWLAANALFGRVLLVTGGLVTIVAGFLMAAGLDVGTLVVAVNAALFAPLFAGWFLVHRVVRRMSRDASLDK